MYNSRIILAALAAAIVVVHGHDLEPNDVPPECRSICQPVVDLENSCDRQFEDDRDRSTHDQQYRDCVCSTQNANQALSTCQNCVVQYPNYFLDLDDNDTDDNEIEQWLRDCGFSTATNQTGSAGVTPPSPIRGPGATGIFSGSLTTATYTYTEIHHDVRGPGTATYTGKDSDTITRVLVFPAGATPHVPGQSTVSRTTGSVSFTTATTTDAQGNTRVVTSPATTFDGAAAVATAGPLLGAGMAIMLAGMAL
ncbi:uncharacterized protein MYCFIDRAFT_78806 [Pseudocercospora fijiensis CIRAD86]|uniref:Uncharacterized protein n=1 Tax=Pseudocercospora fijiensis (strain CIRAD86) TaxID=383855 RepID=M2ZRU2_PSEFD|nr:uncharacterized protein MYCFIDRAFT_78806 [Pseudocercospora fijiensis CIRAD86]EME81744.1 hypothetical protein MYCFIDRAFT_78806 [Pseudocercospora fijiensis CIRAD86]